MAIEAIDTINRPQQEASIQKSLGKDDFLKLFVMQLRFQNPLNPMNNTEFTAQLAQFSALEQLNNMNAKLQNLLLFQNSLQNTLANNLIGRMIKFPGNEVYLKDRAEIGYTLQEDAQNVKISIYNSNSGPVREIYLGQQKSGENNYVWDGTDNSGNLLPEGYYKIKVEAFNKSGNTVDVSTEVYRKVTGITFDNNITYLVVDNSLKVQLSDIKEIKGGE
ncbi:MAG: flagellar hook assembly protein FlgD [Thermodesulfovibrionales bacterium]